MASLAHTTASLQPLLTHVTLAYHSLPPAQLLLRTSDGLVRAGVPLGSQGLIDADGVVTATGSIVLSPYAASLLPPALGGSHAFFRAGAATAAFLHPGTPDDPRGAPLSLADLDTDAPVAAHVLAPDPLAVAYDELHRERLAFRAEMAAGRADLAAALASLRLGAPFRAAGMPLDPYPGPPIRPSSAFRTGLGGPAPYDPRTARAETMAEVQNQALLAEASSYLLGLRYRFPLLLRALRGAARAPPPADLADFPAPVLTAAVHAARIQEHGLAVLLASARGEAALPGPAGASVLALFELPAFDYYAASLVTRGAVRGFKSSQIINSTHYLVSTTHNGLVVKSHHDSTVTRGAGRGFESSKIINSAKY